MDTSVQGGSADERKLPFNLDVRVGRKLVGTSMRSQFGEPCPEDDEGPGGETPSTTE
jgi:hypothetical protein